MEDWRTPSFKRKKILAWKDVVKSLMPFAHRKDKHLLTDADANVEQLCNQLELLMFHGSLVKEYGGIPFWAMLERMSDLNPPCLSLRTSLRTVVSFSTLLSPLARARAWLRQALNSKLLEESLGFMLAHPAVLNKFFHRDALLCTPDDANILMAVVRSLNALHFNLATDSVVLNYVPKHLHEFLDVSLPAAGSSSSPSASAKIPDASVLSLSFDGTLDRLTHPLDSMARRQSTERKRLFGCPLRDLVLDEALCVHAHLNPKLGIPNAIVKLLSLLGSFIDTADLFRQRAPLSAVEDLRKAMELDLPLPGDSAVVTIVLVQWLNQLPEPLLGFSHYQAILACQDIDDVEHRKRNLAILVQEMPWYARPLLLRLLPLLFQCTLPQHAVNNNLNIVAMALLATPWLLRPRPPVAGLFPPSPEERERDQMAATAAGAGIVEFLISNHEEIFAAVYEDVIAQQTMLTYKCSTIRQLQQALMSETNVVDAARAEDDKICGLLWDCWDALQPADQRISTNCSSDQTTLSSKSASSVQMLLVDGRWARCGLSSQGPLLSDFNARQGLLALECLLNFLRKYNEKATAVVCDFALNRSKQCSIAQVVMRITSFVATALQLLPSVDGHVLSMQQLARQPFWALLNDARCFQELFDLGMLCFDDCWKNLTERAGELPSKETCPQALMRTRGILIDLLSQGPVSLEAVWDAWIAIKLAAEEALFQLQRPAIGKKHLSSEYISARALGASAGSEECVAAVVLTSAHPDPSLRPKNRSRSNTVSSTGSIGDVPGGALNTVGINRYVGDASENEQLNAQLSAALEAAERSVTWKKSNMGVTSSVFGASKILSMKHVDQLEQALPSNYQCCDWSLLFRMSLHGANTMTLLHRAGGHNATLLVIQDSRGGIFGVLLTEALRTAERDKYYGNGTMGVWSFCSGTIKFYPWSYKNSYFLLSSKDNLAVGGGGHFAIYLDGDLNHGSSGSCDTFNSPCLAFDEEFQCVACELFSLTAPKG